MLVFMENNVTPLYQYFKTDSSGKNIDISDVGEIMKINQESFGWVTFFTQYQLLTILLLQKHVNVNIQTKLVYKS